MRADASAGDAYAPIGYYENFVVRGYSLNAANSYRINGMSAVGEQSIALENKQQVQLLKGLAGLQSGVNEPAGLIDYRTKRPEHVRSVTLGTDEQGSRYVAADLGDWFGAERTLGVRVNAAREDINSYVDHANGYRNFLSLAGDWKISPQSLLQLDVEYQHRQQRSVPGYQLLGGTQVPRDIDVHRLLGYQPWARPVEMDSLNAQLRYAYQFNDNWRATAEASRSRSVINDFSAFAWGCYGAASCADIVTPNFFSAQGEYDVYDYRSPDDTRVHDQVRATLEGHVVTGMLDHRLSIGGDWLRRTIERFGSVNEFVGSGSIDRDPEVFAQTDVALDPKQRRLDSRQRALVLADRIGLGSQWELSLGARYVRLDERAFDRDGLLERRTRKDAVLPQAALLFKPQQQVSLYASYAKSLAAGGTAPWFADNADEILPPTNAYQLETGAKIGSRWPASWRGTVRHPPGLPVHPAAGRRWLALRATRPPAQSRSRVIGRRRSHRATPHLRQRCGDPCACRRHRHCRVRGPSGDQRAQAARQRAGRLQRARHRWIGATGRRAIQRAQVRRSPR